MRASRHSGSSPPAVSGPRVAVVDIGSNSVRLLLSDGADKTRAATVTALKAGAAADGSLSPAALERLASCLADYATDIQDFGPDLVLAAGTSAVRDAPNHREVGAVVNRHLLTELRILTGDDEAALAFAGARRLFPGDGGALVLDIGGGSTEVVWGLDSRPAASISLPLGCVRQTERFITSDPPDADQVAALAADAETLLVAGIESIGGRAATGSLPLVGVAGTVTSIAAITHGRYDRETIHGCRLSLDALIAVKNRLVGMSITERQRVPGLHPDRAAVIIAGAVIAEESLRALGRDALIVSELDILDGLLELALKEDVAGASALSQKSLFVSDGCDRRDSSSSVSGIWPDMQETLRPSFAVDARPPLQTQGPP